MQKMLRRGKVVMGPPFGAQPFSCFCDPVMELKYTPAQRQEWWNACPNCKAQTEPFTGVAYSESLGGFVGSGVTAPDAKVITPVAPPTLPPSNPLDRVAPPPETLRSTETGTRTSPTTGASTMAGFSFLGTGVGTAIGGPVGGAIGGSLGGAFEPGGAFGSSRCPGPYNFDPVTGGCVPKADYGARIGYPIGPGTGGRGGGLGLSGGCPEGHVWRNGRCEQVGVGGALERWLPGGETGTGVDVYGEATVGSFGMPALVPATVSQPTRRCPPGAVLGKDNLCYQKGAIPNKWRKWPKPPRPALTAGDMKTLRRAKSLQNKVKRAAQGAGFSCRKR